MRYVKARKPRWYYKRDGKTRSLDMCDGCHSFFCDPMCDSKEWRAKKRDRSQRGVCVSCNSNPCKCKSKGVAGSIVLHNNRKKRKHED